MSTETMASDSLELKPGLAGFFDDWSSDQRAFKGVPWGKAMMWIFLVSDTFIFGCFRNSSFNFWNFFRIFFDCDLNKESGQDSF